MSNVLVITTSLRANSNSDILAGRLIAGAKDAGHAVEHISLKGKDIRYCIGCRACRNTLKCIQKDDAIAITEQVRNADTLVFATPIYYHEMSGQMKTLLDRLNPLYNADYRFRRVYLLSTATRAEDSIAEKAVSGLQGWVDCFPDAAFAGALFCGGLPGAGEAAENETELRRAYEFGKTIA
jgi:multimeric flavodoxin WrbA